jgi:hypothetical protein
MSFHEPVVLARRAGSRGKYLMSMRLATVRKGGISGSIEAREAGGDGVLKLPFVFEYERTLLLDVFVADDASGVRCGELDALGALVAEDLEAGEAKLDGIFFLQFHFLAVGSDGPGLEEGELRFVIEVDGCVAVIVASFGAQKFIGATMPGFNFAVVLDGGLQVIEQDDGDCILGIFREGLVSGGAQPIGRVIREHTRREAAGDRREGYRAESGERSGGDRSNYFLPIRHFAEQFARRHRFSLC